MHVAVGGMWWWWRLKFVLQSAGGRGGFVECARSPEFPFCTLSLFSSESSRPAFETAGPVVINRPLSLISHLTKLHILGRHSSKLVILAHWTDKTSSCTLLFCCWHGKQVIKWCLCRHAFNSAKQWKVLHTWEWDEFTSYLHSIRIEFH